ncbi:MAG: phosphate ABC transporter permease subunit PstC [Myxococcota bacterium]
MFHCHKKLCCENFFLAFLMASALISVGITLGVLVVLFTETFIFFEQVSWRDFLFDTKWTPLFASKHFGIWPLLAGTFLTSAIAMAVALPFGILAAVYLSEFATSKTRRILKPLLEILSGVPTVVYGYFALVFLTPLLQQFVPGLSGFNALSPGLIMGMMIIPLVCSLSEDALYAVPMHLREAAYALGAGKVTTICRVVIPAAYSGIKASVVLAISRAIGETMIVTLAAGQQPQLTLDPRVPIETMTAYIVQVSMGDTPRGTIEYQSIFVVGATLFAITFIINYLLGAKRRTS